jgi:hypothetical protein
VEWNRVHYYGGHYWPNKPAPDDDECRTIREIIGRGNRSARRKSTPGVVLCTTNPTWAGPGSNQIHRVGKLATNRLSWHGCPKNSRTDYIRTMLASNQLIVHSLSASHLPEHVRTKICELSFQENKKNEGGWMKQNCERNTYVKGRESDRIMVKPSICNPKSKF